MPKKTTKKALTKKEARAGRPPDAAPAVGSPAEGRARRAGPSLVVVESPAKEMTITRFLKGAYIVRSSFS